MSTLNRFESVFNAAAREVFAQQAVEIGRGLIVHDLAEALQDDFLYLAKGFLSVLETRDKPEWEVFGGDAPFSVREVLNAVEQARPDLVVTYRHLHSAVGEWPHSLGEHVDVLTQATSTPVLVLPHPGRRDVPGHALKNTDRVMAVTDHLAGDHRLVSHAAHFTQDGGTLYLAHVEDDTVFERYIAAIGKIQDLDTGIAREEIRAICRDPEIDVLEAYAAAMAWGAQRRHWFEATVGNHREELRKLLRLLRESADTRIVDFIKEYYPDYCTLCMPELDNEHHHVKKFEKVFNDLDLIINDHKKYNLHGVIKDTEKRFESIFIV